MGFSHSWVAVQGIARAQVLDTLGMAVSEVQAELWEGTSLFEWEDDWLVILQADNEDSSDELHELGRASPAAILCRVDDQAMRSTATEYRGGKDLWSVTADQGRRVFRVLGQPPQQLDAIISAARHNQPNSNEDAFFDIPAILAESICGFRLGKGELAAIQHTSLAVDPNRSPASAAQARKTAPGFLARMFGRR
jgi:hypothetical protein